MEVELLECLPCRGEELPWVVVAGVLSKVLPDSGSHCETAIRVDVDLANSALGSLGELALGDSYGVLDLSSILVDGGDVLLRDGGGSVENDRESGDPLLNLVEDVKTDFDLLAWFELECSVACADGDGEGVNSSAVDKVLNFAGLGVVVVLRGNLILNSCEDTKLSLNSNSIDVGVLDNILVSSMFFS